MIALVEGVGGYSRERLSCFLLRWCLPDCRLAWSPHSSRLPFHWSWGAWSAKLLVHDRSVVRDPGDVKWQNDFDAETFELIIYLASRPLGIIRAGLGGRMGLKRVPYA